jgi:gamma-glutamyltranspeptidase
VIGGSGGTKITTYAVSVHIKHLWLNKTFKEAIDWPLIHHQSFPNEIVYENDFPNDILSGLKSLGLKTKSSQRQTQSSPHKQTFSIISRTQDF